MSQLKDLFFGILISEEKNMFVAENFIRSLVAKYGVHTVYTDGGRGMHKHAIF